MTIINGAAFITLLLAFFQAWTGGHFFHPFLPRPVTYGGRIDHQELVSDEWRHKVTFHPTSVRFFIDFIAYFSIALTLRLAVLEIKGSL
jgi:hypothetical protein